jgi:flagellar motor switch protein FliG
MGNKRSIVVTAYGHNKIIDKIAVSSFESSENSYYSNQESDAKTYCDTINSLELKDDSWIVAKILSENTQYLLNVFTPVKFSDMIIKIDDRAIQKILREIDPQDLAKSLKGPDETIKEKIFKNMSKKASQMLKEDMECMGLIRPIDVKESQEKILNTIRHLEQTYEIVIRRFEDEINGTMTD